MPPKSAVPPRPRQASFAGWVIVIGSVLVVVSAFEQVAGLQSIESQEAIRDFLATPPGDGMGLDFDAAREILRVLALVAGAAGAASAILGGYALMRSTSARLGLSILAAPLLVGGLAVSGLVSGLVIAGVVMLWLQPTTSWFAGVTPPEPRPGSRTALRSERRAAGASREPRPAAGVPPDEQQRTLWPPPVPPAAPGDGPSDAPSAGPADPAAGPSAGPPGMVWPPPRPIELTAEVPASGSRRAAVAATRPSALNAACLVTWISCGVVALALAATGLVLLSVPDAVFDQLRAQDPELLSGSMGESELRRLTLIGCSVGVVWCAAASVFAVAAFQGRRWGWIALVVSASVSGVTSLVLLLGSLALLVTLAGSAAVLGLLLRPESRAWCRPRPGARDSVSP